MHPKNNFFIGRILTIFLIVSFLLPTVGACSELSRGTLRPMTGEGAGTEELQASLAGQEESNGKVLSYRHLISHRDAKLPPLQLYFASGSSQPLFLPSNQPLFIPYSLMVDTMVRVVHEQDMNPMIHSADRWFDLHVLPSRDRDIRIRLLRHDDNSSSKQRVDGTYWLTNEKSLWNDSDRRLQIRRTPKGLIVTPHRAGEFFYTEWFPDEIRLTVNQWARFGSIIEKIRDDRGEITQSLGRSPANELVEYWHGDGKDSAIQIIRTGLMPIPDGDGLGPQLFVLIPRGRWDPAQLKELLGFALNEGRATRDLPIRSADGPRALRVGIQHDAGGLLRILTSPEPIIGLPNNLRVLVRLLAYLTEPANSPRYDGTVATAKLKEIVHKHDQAGNSFNPEVYPIRYEATWALARRPEATDFLLERLRPGQKEWEKTPTIRRMIIAEWVYALERNSNLFSLDQKAKIWTALSGLLTGVRFDNSLPLYEQDLNEQVQWAALQGFVRFIPPAEIDDRLNLYRIQTVNALEFAMHHSAYELVRDEAAQFLTAIHSKRPVRIQFWQGAPLEDLPGRQGGGGFSSGLEESVEAAAENRNYFGSQS
jgi:hypothetical protein